MYIKKKYRRLLDLADKQFIIPASFERFIKEKERLHNLVIKGKNNQCLCTYCNHNFVAKSKVNSVVKCPNCKQKLLVKTNRLKYYVFKDNLQFLDKIEDIFVLRTFELYTTYKENKIKHHITEFMRTFMENGDINEFVSNNVSNHMGYMYVSHWQYRKGWHGRNYRWAYRDIIGMVSPYNLKSLLKNTDLKYSQLDKFISKMGYVDFIYYFRIANRRSFEMLVKMKLYNLVHDVDKFYRGKNFQEIFKLPKSFYSFMKKHNINYRQLQVLQLIKKEDIKLINKLTRFQNLEELSKYVDLETAYYKVLKRNEHCQYEYLDYLEMCKQLDYPMNNKRILYPKNLREAHNKVMKLYNVVQNELIDKQIQGRLEELNKKTYKNKKYIVFPAPNVASLIDESKQQNNCVKSYSEDYGLAKKDLFFMRELNNQDKSLVTIEVRNNEIVQARIYDNDPPTKEQQKFLDKWQSNVLNKSLTNI